MTTELTALWIDADKFNDNGISTYSSVDSVLAYVDNDGDCVGYLEPQGDQFYAVIGNQEFSGPLDQAEKFLFDNWVEPNCGPCKVTSYLD